MGFKRIGIATTTTGWLNSDELVISTRYPRDTFYIGWCCDYAHPNDTFNVSIRYRGIQKGSPSSLPDWSAWKKVSRKGSACNEHPNSYYGDYWYAVDVADFGITNKLTDTSWTMEGRKYDYIEFQIGISMTLAAPEAWNNNQTQTITEYGNSRINYEADYQATSIKKANLNQLQIVLNHPEGWRKDDRWGFDLIRTKSGNNLLDRSKACYGKLDGNGDIWVDKSFIKEELKPNTPYIVNIRIVRDWEPAGKNIHTIVSTIQYDDSPQTNTPTVRVTSSSADGVVFNIADSGDKSHPIETVRVSLKGAGYACDTYEGEIGKVTLSAQPFGTNEYEVTGWNDTYGVSQTVTVKASVAPQGNRTHIDSADGFYSVKLQYNPQFSISVEPEVETYKFAGRSTATSFLGNGDKTQIDLSGDILNEDASDWLALSKSGQLIIIRFPDGKRYQCSIDKFGVDWEQRQIKGIKISGTEVS